MSTNQSEKVLEYWDRTATSFDSIYTGEKPGWAKFLDKKLRQDMYQRFEWVMKNSGDMTGQSVCDLGCGTGRYVIAYAQAGARRALGIDGAANMVKLASGLIEKAGVADRAEVREVPILDFPENEKFDVTIAVGVFDYTPDTLPFLKKMRNVTESRFLGTFPRLWTWRMPVRKVRLSLLGCPVFFYSADQVESALREAGFILKRIESVGAIYCVLAEPVPEPGANTSAKK